MANENNLESFLIISRVVCGEGGAQWARPPRLDERSFASHDLRVLFKAESDRSGARRSHQMKRSICYWALYSQYKVASSYVITFL